MKTMTMTVTSSLPATTPLVPMSGAALLDAAAAACPRLRAGAVAPVSSAHTTGLSLAGGSSAGSSFGGGGAFAGSARIGDVRVDATGLLPRGAPV